MIPCNPVLLSPTHRRRHSGTLHPVLIPNRPHINLTKIYRGSGTLQIAAAMNINTVVMGVCLLRLPTTICRLRLLLALKFKCRRRRFLTQQALLVYPRPCVLPETYDHHAMHILCLCDLSIALILCSQILTYLQTPERFLRLSNPR